MRILHKRWYVDAARILIYTTAFQSVIVSSRFHIAIIEIFYMRTLLERAWNRQME